MRRSAEIQAEATLSPAVALFGDTVLAHVDVLLNRTRVDPDSVRVAADFAPFEIVGPPRRLRRDAGDTTYLSRTFVLRCLSGTCVPSGRVRPATSSRPRGSVSPRRT